MIPVSEPLLDDQARANVAQAMASGWISADGPFVAAFEAAWAGWCGAAHGVAVSSGTAALTVALRALDLAPGDEVILPSLTIMSCALAVLECGATPVLVDSDPGTGCLDVAQVAARISPRTRAVLPVHLFGRPAAMAPLIALAARHGLAIVEDAAQAHGATCPDLGPGRRVGAIGRMGCFSFYANKTITTGEGGMVLTDDPALAERLRALRNLCFGPGRRFLHHDLGYNFRMTNLQAAVGVAQVARIDDHLARRRRIAAAYAERLSDVPGLILPAVGMEAAGGVCWMVPLVLADALPLDAADLAHRLRVRGVDSRPWFLGLHEQPALLARGLFAGEHYPVCERLARRGLILPSGLTITDAQIDTVCAAVRDSLRDSLP